MKKILLFYLLLVFSSTFVLGFSGDIIESITDSGDINIDYINEYINIY